MKTVWWPGALLLVLLAGQVASASVIWTPSIGSRDGPPTDLFEYTKARTTNLNLSDPEVVRSAVRDVADRATLNATQIAQNLTGGSNLSNTIRASYRALHPASTVGAVRTNLAVAHSATGLSSAVIALYDQMGTPLTLSQRLAVISAASETPSTVATAGALLLFATIDARHYQEAGMMHASSSKGPLIGNISTFATLQRRMAFVPTGENLTLQFEAHDQSLIDALNEAAAAYDSETAFLAADAIAQALDEISGMVFESVPVNGISRGGNCGTSTYYFALPSDVPKPCSVLIGDKTNNIYGAMRRGGTSLTDDENVLVLDIAGDDVFRHRAGGGTRNNPVQVNVDLAGNDRYDKALSTPGAAQGGGLEGVGFLYDASGNDTYRAHSASGGDLDSVFQGAAMLGAGVLVDNAGNDLYVALDAGYTQTAHSAHAQGVAAIGLGLLRDGGGNDAYFFNATEGNRHIASTGAQAFAAGPGSAAFLVDIGNGNDNYSAGQDAVQAAAALHGFAVLLDQGGENEYNLVAAPGCVRLYREVCAENPVQYAAIGGWSQGYANTNGTAFLIAGTGADTFRTIRLIGESDEFEARSILAAANTSGLAVVVNYAGEDEYDASIQSLGHGDAGVAIFTDAQDTDRYLCPATSCYGDGLMDGRGIFRDVRSTGDEFADGRDHGSPLVSHNLGLSVKEE